MTIRDKRQAPRPTRVKAIKYGSRTLRADNVIQPHLALLPNGHLVWAFLSPLYAIMGSLFLTACAVNGNANLEGLSLERIAQIRQICTDTMKFAPGETRFDGCLSSLSETAAHLDGGRKKNDVNQD